MNISMQSIARARIDYYKPVPKARGQRLGQWLMNTLVPAEVCQEIFYEKDDNVAYTKFVEKYADKYTEKV